jgi:hypothetical protein
MSAKAKQEEADQLAAVAQAGERYKDDDNESGKKGVSNAKQEKGKLETAVAGIRSQQMVDELQKIEGSTGVGIIQAWVYVWKDNLDLLEPDIWR